MKLILGVALALTASLSVNAMAFVWAADNGTAAENGYVIYAVLGDTTASWNSLADLQAAAVGGEAIGTITKIRQDYTAGGTVSNASVDKSHDFYFVIVKADSSQYASSDIYTASSFVYNPDGMPPENPPGTASFSIAGLGYTNFGTTPVPEPTSGLLVLVGLAGLMLRRKRA